MDYFVAHLEVPACARDYHRAVELVVLARENFDAKLSEISQWNIDLE